MNVQKLLKDNLLVIAIVLMLVGGYLIGSGFSLMPSSGYTYYHDGYYYFG